MLIHFRVSRLFSSRVTCLACFGAAAIALSVALSSLLCARESLACTFHGALYVVPRRDAWRVAAREVIGINAEVCCRCCLCRVASTARACVRVRWRLQLADMYLDVFLALTESRAERIASSRLLVRACACDCVRVCAC